MSHPTSVNPNSFVTHLVNETCTGRYVRASKQLTKAYSGYGADGKVLRAEQIRLYTAQCGTDACRVASILSELGNQRSGVRIGD
jgi:hypothetical protein